MIQLLETYQTLAYHYDELAQDSRQVRRHWQHFLESLDALGPQELQQRLFEARRQILDNGVSYNVYDDPRGIDRPWELDPIPFLIDSKEWAETEAALIQRAELLNLVLRDIYGPRDLIRKGLIPQEVIFKHAGFFRVCSTAALPSEQHLLVFYAADLARDPQGRFKVIGDRTQAPSGSGYALENRIVTSRVLPSLFRDSQVHRLALFFRAVRATLASIAPSGNDDPNIVILSPGPLNETYFEHAYLANYLGYPLVQGSDLTVRKNQVWLSSLDGLKRVDVILRRLDDDWSDPLELRPDSQLGVAGLLEVARCGNVKLANPLGSSVLENPGLMPFLPKIAKHFLGKDLLLPSVETWWCGDPEQHAYVMSRFDELVIKPLSPYEFGARIHFPGQMLGAEKNVLKAQINAEPDLYVAQQYIPLSTVPIFQDQSLQPRQSVLRSFAVARDDAYIIMPGGLTRIAPTMDQWMISSQVGGISKDTWVLASEPEKQTTLWLTTEQTGAVDNLFGSVSSRIAENLYWLGRYAERSEGQIRLLRKIVARWIDYYYPTEQEGADQCSGLQRMVAAVLKTRGSFGNDIDRRLLTIIQDGGNLNSLTYSLQALVQAAHSVRERLSSDTWYTINSIREELTELRSKNLNVPSDSLDHLDALISALMAFSGLSMESLSRDQDWLFLDLGRRIERSQNLVDSLRNCLIEPCNKTAETTVLETLLIGSESLMSYRRRYRSHLHINEVLDLLLLDERHPRSLAYQFSLIQKHLDDLPVDQKDSHLSNEKKILLRASTKLRLAEMPVLGTVDPDSGHRDRLDTFFGELSAHIWELSDAVSERCFPHAQPARQLAPLRHQVES